jgi:drug/metabolite transporter (DMT)-like permease
MDILTTWPVLVAVSVSTYALSVLLQKVILRNDKSDPVAFAIVFQALAGSLIFVGAFLHGFELPDLSRYWANVLLMVVLYGAGNIVIFHALKLIDASTFTILFASRALWTIVGALVFLGEQYTWARLVGTLLIISSIALVSWSTQKIELGKGELLGLLAGVLFGAAFANDAVIVRNSDVLSYEALAFVLPAVGLLLAQPQAIRKMPHLLGGRILMKLVALSVLYGASAVTVFLAYKVGHNASQIAPLVQTTTVVTVVLSILFLKEKTALGRKSAGAIICFIGVVLVG